MFHFSHTCTYFCTPLGILFTYSLGCILTIFEPICPDFENWNIGDFLLVIRMAQRERNELLLLYFLGMVLKIPIQLVDICPILLFHL